MERIRLNAVSPFEIVSPDAFPCSAPVLLSFLKAAEKLKKLGYTGFETSAFSEIIPSHVHRYASEQM